MSLPRFSVHNSVLVNMIMILIVVIGTYALIQLPSELLPQVRLNRVFVITNLSGASPEEVERLVTSPIEDAIQNVDHVDMFLSRSLEGQSRVNVIFHSIGADEFRRVYQDLRQEIDRAELPDQADRPRYISLETSTWIPAGTVVVSGELPHHRMKEIAEELRDEIRILRGVDSVSLSGVREREIRVDVDPHRLYQNQLTLEQIAERLRRQNVSLPSGNLKLGDYEFLVRSMEDFRSIEEIESVVVQEDGVGQHVQIRDIAAVRDTFEEPRSLARLNGVPSVSLDVLKRPEGNTLELVDRLKALAAEKELSLPPGVRITITNDNSERIRDSILRLTSSGMYGGLLVLLTLLIFLGWRNALIVAWGIPITFLLSFAFLEYIGESLNESTLFALVLVLGMIVDDAIVVIENVARYLNRGFAPREAAILGGQEVMWPVVASTLTTVAAFLPLMLLPGIIGEFMKVIPICVSLALMASLFESLVILPAHASDLGKSDPERRNSRVNRIIRRLSVSYRRMMGVFLRRRWIYLPLVLVLIASSFLVIPFVGVDLFEDDDFSVIMIRIWMPEGTHIGVTDDLARQFERAALELPSHEYKAVITQVGRLDTQADRESGPDVAQVIVDLVEQKHRTRVLDEIIADLEARTGYLTGYRHLEMGKVPTGPPVGRPVEVKIRGPSFEELERLSERIKQYLGTLPGVHAIQDDFQRGKQEIRIRVDKGRAHLAGLDAATVARQVQYAVEGLPATVFREGREAVDVIVSFRPEARRTLEDVIHLNIPSPSGGLVPLHSVASLNVERGWADIRRFDGVRAITVGADVDPTLMNAIEVNQRLREYFRDIGVEHPGYRLDFRGEFKEFEEAFDNVTRLFLVGIVLIYLILGAQFRSYLQPMLVLFAIPFAFVGAMASLLINGYVFSINIMFGMVALSGVAVNDSIVLISFINAARQRGASLYRAILTAAKRRLRPIFLTTVTTVFGLLPMSLGVGGESVVWMPLAGTIVWGLGVATFLILLVIPPLYAAQEDVVCYLRKRLGYDRLER